MPLHLADIPKLLQEMLASARGLCGTPKGSGVKWPSGHHLAAACHISGSADRLELPPCRSCIRSPESRGCPCGPEGRSMDPLVSGDRHVRFMCACLLGCTCTPVLVCIRGECEKADTAGPLVNPLGT